jgi:O-antigen/teichoic acid export membrane protein
MTRSIFSNWVGLLVLAGSTAVLTPIMIHHLGAVDYGVWVLVGSILDYYGLLDLGMRSALFRYVALFRGADVREEIDRTFSSALFLVIATGGFICILSIAVAAIVPRVWSLRDTSPAALGWLLLLLGISVGITFPTRMLATYISAHQRWDLYNAAGIVNITARAVAIVIVLKLGYGILAVAIATVLVAWFSLGQHIVFVRLADPLVHARIHLISVRRMRELFAFSMRSLLVQIGDYLRFYSSAAVIASILNIALITPFNVASRLIECFKSVVIAAGGPVLATMTELDGSRQQQQLRDLLLRSTRFLALLSVLGASLLLVDGRALLRVWVGEEMMSAYPVLAVLTLGYLVNLAQHPSLLIVIAKGQHGPLGWWTIAEGVANIALSVVWGMSHGLLGVAAGTIVPMLVIKLMIQPYYACKAAELDGWRYLSEALARPMIVGVLFTVVAAKLFISPELNAITFFTTVGLQVLVFLGLASAIGLTRAERQWLWDSARRRLCLWGIPVKQPTLSTQKPDLN